MKKGEKGAMFFAVALIIGVGVMTFYLESEVDLGKGSTLVQSVVPGGDTSQPVEKPGPGVIPVGINPDALPDAQGHGATLLTIYCVQCHDLPTPSMHTADEWHAVLERMDKHIQKRRGGMLSRVAMPSRKDWDDLHAYLADNGQQPLDSSQYDDLDSEAGQAFTSTCSQCHAAPDPSQHLAREWPRIVLRMKYNMESAGKPVPDASTTELIVGYLQKYSREESEG